MNGINFQGQVFLAGSTKNLSPKKEIKEIKKFAEKNDCDVMVYNRDHYMSGAGIYEAFLVKEDKHTGQNLVVKKTFNFKFPVL